MMAKPWDLRSPRRRGRALHVVNVTTVPAGGTLTSSKVVPLHARHLTLLGWLTAPQLTHFFDLTSISLFASISPMTYQPRSKTWVTTLFPKPPKLTAIPNLGSLGTCRSPAAPRSCQKISTAWATPVAPHG